MSLYFSFKQGTEVQVPRKRQEGTSIKQAQTIFIGKIKLM
jgi:hypothetical protein